MTTDFTYRTRGAGQSARLARPLFLVGVILLEMALLRHVSRGLYMPLRDSVELPDQIFALVPAAVKASLLTGGFALAVSLARAPQDSRWIQFADHRPSRLAVFFNVLCFVTLAGLFLLLQQAGEVHGWLALALRTTPLIWVGMLASWAGFVAPYRTWHQIIAANPGMSAIVFAVLFASSRWLDGELAARIGALLIRPTIFLSSQIYALTGETLAIVGASPEGYPIIGGGSFYGQISPTCSGYEGMILSTLFLGTFFYLQPRKMTVLHKGLVILLACVAIFLLNVLRLALLFYIGVHFSPEIAQEGFHTNFGLVSLVVVVTVASALTLIFSAPRSSASEKADTDVLNFDDDAPPRMLIPLIYLIGSSLLCGLFSGKFFWLYPVPILAAAVGLYQIRSVLRGLNLEMTAASFLLALATFLAWLQLVPADAKESEAFQDALFSAPFPLIVLWLSLRLFGATVIVPLVEELAFRGAFDQLLRDALRRYWTAGAAQVGAMIAVAVIFGLVHSDFLAGALAGLAFGVARWRRDELGDAFVCHALTNLMLSLYILLSGNWSYWV
jgi:exosortase E/protease (VPEID-CTERM system)